jgi:hypothetical protein
VQQTCTVPPNTTTSQNCTGTANAVDSPTTLVVTASYYNSTQSTNVTVVPHQ